MEDFEGAAYFSLFPNERSATEDRLDSRGLTPRQRARLAAHFDDIREVENASLALIIHGRFQSEVCSKFAAAHQVPVMLPSTQATSVLLGMDADRLLAEIQKFWDGLQVLPRPVSLPRASAPPTASQGAPAMPSHNINLNVTGGSANISLSTGDHSPTQAGTGNTQTHSADLSALLPVLQQLLEAIGEVESPKAREKLAQLVESARAEAGKKNEPDAGRIKSALDAIKSGADMLDNSGKIIGLCNKAYQFLAPFLGLPPSPLP